MSSRTFTDDAGRRWTAWKVIPLAAERRLARRRLERPGSDGEREGVEPRSGGERRHDPSRADHPDRRSGSERREEPGRRAVLDRRSGDDRRDAPRLKAQLPGAYAGGWLCFDGEGERRRLAPAPDGWADADEGALRDWLHRAAPTRAGSASQSHEATDRD